MNKRVSTRIIAYFFALIYIIMLFTPIFRQYYLLVPVIVGFIFLVITLISFFYSVQRNGVLLFSLLLFFLSLFYRAVGISTAGIGNYLHRFLRLISIWIAFYCMYYLDERHRNKIFYIASASMLVNIAHNIFLWTTNPNASIKAFKYVNSIGIINIGRADWQYCVALFGIIFLIRYLMRKMESLDDRRKNRYNFLFFIICSIYFIVWGTSTTSVLTYIITIALIVFINIGREKNYATKILILLFLGLVIILMKNLFLEMLIYYFTSIGNTKIVTRLYDMYYIASSSTSVSDSSAMVRIELISIDISSWLKNPLTFLLGNGYKTSTGMDLIAVTRETGAGNHSSLVDIAPRYGLIGLILYFQIVKRSYRYISGFLIDEKSRIITIIFYIYLLFNMIFNDIIKHNLLFVVLFMYPMAFRFSVKEKIEHNL